MRKKLGICLGAGGSRGVAHIGFLQALEEEGIVPDMITGCSMGAIVGGVYACGVSIQRIKEKILSLRYSDFVAPDFFIRKKDGFFGTEKIKRLIEEEIGKISFQETKIPFSCVAVDLLTGKEHVFKRGFVAPAIVASSSIPSIFRPTLTDKGEQLVDGGIIDRVPAHLLKEMGADVIVAVDVLGSLSQKKELLQSSFSVLFRMIEVMDEKQTRMLKEQRKLGIDFWIEPDLKEMNQYSLKEIKFAYEKGYECGKANVKEILKKIG